MNESVRIDCGICADLIPLVEDGVACEQSREAVRRHIAECSHCCERYSALSGVKQEAVQEAESDPDDAKVIRQVREKMAAWILNGMLFSLIAGAVIVSAASSGPWLAALIFPALCGIIYLTGVRVWKWTPLAAGCCWIVITLLTQGARLSDYPMALLTSLYPIALSYLGVLSAALLKYAFKGEF